MTNHEPFSGNLQNIPLSDLLQNLQSSKVTGTLTLQHDGQEKSIYVKDGNIVSASSNLSGDRLGYILINAGKLRREQMDAALKLQGATHKKFGAIIVELGFLTPKELFDGLKLQVKEIIYSLFRWEEGHFQFTPGHLPDQAIPLVLNPIELISEIIERLQKEP
ncbi:MAG TPA: DUF4388 domain-containing protein [Nitrospiria bacterium]|nr:DUF4388 domain-containing protein [Nitrospiria bacterium]